MSTTLDPALDDVLQDAFTLLEGEDDHTMGDPGEMGATGRARQALWTLLRDRGVELEGQGFAEAYRLNDRAQAPVEVEHERLRTLDRACEDQRWQKALAAVDGAERPLADLSPDESRRVVAEAYSALNSLGHRANALRDIARDRVLCRWLDQIATAYPGAEADVLRGYVAALRQNERSYVLWNGLAIGVDPGPYFEYAGGAEHLRGHKILADGFEPPYGTSAADWRRVEG